MSFHSPNARHCHKGERRHFIRQLELSLTVTSFSMKEQRNFNRKKKLNGWIDFQSNYLPEQLAFFWLQRNSQYTIAIQR